MVDTSLFKRYGFILILVIIGFSLLAALYPVASTAGTGLGEESMCSSASCFYNSSRTTAACTNTNTTPADTTECTAASFASGGFPLASLFAGGGVLFLVLAAGILMYYLKIAK